jgi:hypothetical protein
MPWSSPLAHPVPVRNATKILRTLHDARAYVLANKETGGRNSWQHCAKLLLAAAESGKRSDIAAATKQLELALLLEGKLKL